MLTLLGANLVNAGFNWLLIFGRAGFPALGVAGSAWATVIARVAMAVSLLGVIVRHEKKHQLGLGNISFLESNGIASARLVRLGTPAALQITAEVGVFGAVAALAGRIDPVALAAHQVALNIASVTFMVPLGLASAGAVRVGHAVGRRDALGAERAGWSAIALGAGFMTASAVVFFVAPRRSSASSRPTQPSSPPASRCCASPPRSSCSTACRASRPERCAASATRGRR